MKKESEIHIVMIVQETSADPYYSAPAVTCFACSDLTLLRMLLHVSSREKHVLSWTALWP